MTPQQVAKRPSRKALECFSLNHLPVPASGVAASHRELRLVLGALRVVAHDHVSPSSGNGLWAIARRAVADLDRALVRHLGEAHPSPATLAAQADLEGQHTALVVLAVALNAQLAACRPGVDADWLALRALLGRVIDRLERHLEQEERLAPKGHRKAPGGSDPFRGPLNARASEPRAQSPSIA